MKSSHLLSRLILRLGRRGKSESFSFAGHLQAGSVTFPCSVGKSGITHQKIEGDKATPAGSFRLLHGYYRGDRGPRPKTTLPLQAMRRDDGWCDAPASSRYNRPIRLPLTESHEMLWRQDGLYDIVLVLDYNLHPRRRGRGSAIFLHCARPGAESNTLKSTLGCVALRPADLRRLLPRLSRHVRIDIIR